MLNEEVLKILYKSNYVVGKDNFLLKESFNLKDYYTLYHSTDSDFFNTIDQDNAKKGERFFNPLGNGLYFSTNEKFTKRFGKNTYYYLLPKKSKIRRVNHRTWTQTNYLHIVKSVLRKYAIKWDNLDLGKKVEINRLGNDTPISSLNNFQELLNMWGFDKSQENIEEVVDNINSKYDAIWYKDTDYYQEADEILIPKHSFNKNLFFENLPNT